MADTVRNLMEQMLPELEDLEERGYFSKSEIKQILRRRAYFEYLMKRKAVLKADILRYLQYESRLEELLQHRKAKLGINGKGGFGEGSIFRRMHFIFERATRKFKGDMSLWLGWLQLCKDSHSTKSLSKVATKALQLHPAEPGLWAKVAAWEWEVNADTAGPRALMQRGLRACPRSVSLWVDYFRLELLFAAKLAARRRVLGLQGPAAEQTVETGGVPEGGNPEDAAMAQLLRGGIAQRVFEDAMAALPKDLALRTGCLEALQDVGLAGSEGLGLHIWSTIAADFAHLEAAWDLRARHALAASDGDQLAASGRADQVYEQALAALPTSAMYDHYCAFLQQQMQDAADQQPRTRSLQGAAKQLAQKLLALQQRAISAGHASAKTLLQHQRLLLQLGRARAAAEAAETACAVQPQSLPLWRHCLLLHFQPSKVKNTDRLIELTARGAEAVGPDAASEVWHSSMELLSPAVGDSDTSHQQAALQAMAERMATSMHGRQHGPVEGGMGEVAGHLVQTIQAHSGLPAARTAYQRLLKGPSPGGDFFLAVLRMELQQQPPQRLSDLQLQALFEAAVAQHGTGSVQLWLEYCQFEVQHRHQGAGKVYWRATRSLADPQAFVQAAQPLL